jgi:hypothetical protein
MNILQDLTGGNYKTLKIKDKKLFQKLMKAIKKEYIVFATSKDVS